MKDFLLEKLEKLKILRQTDTGKLKFNPQGFFEKIILALFFLLAFSIPTFSPLTKFNIITWVLTISLVIMILIYLIIFGEFRIDTIVVSLVLFVVSATFSTLINLKVNHRFVITPIALSILLAIIYMYLRYCNTEVKSFLIGAYVATVLFLIAFIFMYRDMVFSLNYNRFISYFGDLNDSALFHSLGAIISLYLLYKRGKWSKIFFFIILIAFIFAGFLTGSKIFILSFGIAFIIVTILHFGKKRWYFSLLIIGALSGILIFLLSRDFFADYRKRLLSFFSFFGIGNNGVDYSSENRFEMFKDGLELFLEKPVFGFGIRGYWEFSSWSNGRSWSHNHYSDLLCSYGLIGFCLFNYPIATLIVGAIREYKALEQKELIIGFLAFVLVSTLSTALDVEKIYFIIFPVFLSMINEKKSLFVIRGVKKWKQS